MFSSFIIYYYLYNRHIKKYSQLLFYNNMFPKYLDSKSMEKEDPNIINNNKYKMKSLFMMNNSSKN